MDIWTRIVKVNIGRIERYGRALVGFGLLLLGLLLPTLWGVVGLYPLITGVIGTDPLYTLLGLETTPKVQPTTPPLALPPIAGTK
jgi:hypothetical protein